MNAPRISAAVAVIATVLIAGNAAAQTFDTSPQYRAYEAQSQIVPKVTLPKMEMIGSALPAPSAERSRGLPASAEDGMAVEVDETLPRRTDAGAIRKAEGARSAVSTIRTGTAPAAREEQKYPAGTVLEGAASVYDGQNLVVDGIPIRLHGAEAPALSQQCMTRKSLVWNCGTRAASRLTELASGKKVRCVVTEPLGSGAAAICSTTGVSDMGAAMIRDGWAVSNGHDRGRYSAQQMTAKSAEIGMWVGPFEAPWTYRARHGQ